MTEKLKSKKQIWWQAIKRTSFDLFSVSTSGDINTIEETKKRKKSVKKI